MRKGLFYILFILYSGTAFGQSQTICDSLILELQDVSSSYLKGSLERKHPELKYYGGYSVLEEISSNAVKKSFDHKKKGVFGPVYNNDKTISYIAVINHSDSLMMRMSYIWLHKGSAIENKLDSLLNLIKNGVPFEQISAENSLDSKGKRNGGDQGWFCKGQIVPEIEEKILASKKGDVFKVLTNSYGWYIVKVTEEPRIREFVEYIEVQVDQCY